MSLPVEELAQDLYLLLNINGDIFAGFWGGVFRSTDNGNNWIPINSGLTNVQVLSLAISGNNIFAGTWDGGTFLSTDNGSSWNAVNTGLTNLDVFAIAISGDNIFAGTWGGIFLSTDNGSSWNAVNNGLTNLFINSLAISGDNIFAGASSSNVYLSTDNGSNWNAVNNGLTNLFINSLAVSGDYIFAGTDDGVWRRLLSEMITSVDEIAPQLPVQFSLFQNYPNPFNPSTKIKYSVPQSSQVQIKIFDVLGNEIETLVNEKKQVGTYEANVECRWSFHQRRIRARCLFLSTQGRKFC